MKLIPVSENQVFDLILKQSEVLAQSEIVPSSYRKRPANIVAAGLAGRSYGWDVMTSMRNFHVIEGTASLRPEAMLGLVRQAGHSVVVEVTDNEARASGTRADTGDKHLAVFTMKDAEAAGLAKKRNWTQYRQAMLTWRAVSTLCRILFPDVVLGAGYVPEELGAEVDEKGEVVEAEVIEVQRVPLIGDQVTQDFKDRIAVLDAGQKAGLKTWWIKEGIPAISSGSITIDNGDRIEAELLDLEGANELIEIRLEGADVPTPA